jgi:hypothetical protein
MNSIRNMANHDHGKSSVGTRPFSQPRKEPKSREERGQKESSMAYRAAAGRKKPALAVKRKGKVKYLTDATPPPELGDNLNA